MVLVLETRVRPKVPKMSSIGPAAAAVGNFGSSEDQVARQHLVAASGNLANSKRPAASVAAALDSAPAQAVPFAQMEKRWSSTHSGPPAAMAFCTAPSASNRVLWLEAVAASAVAPEEAADFVLAAASSLGVEPESSSSGSKLMPPPDSQVEGQRLKASDLQPTAPDLS